MNPIVVSERSREKKLKNNAFYKGNDLYDIQNMKTITSIIHGKDTDEDEALPSEFVNQLEQNLIELIDEETTDENNQNEYKEFIENPSKKSKIDNNEENQQDLTNLNNGQNILQKANASNIQNLVASQIKEECKL